MNGIETNDYRALGLRCGLEVHYQLDTRKKLFCHCPIRLQNRPPDAVIVRHMRPTLSELGEYDGTALMEFKTKKEVHYQLYYDTVCTYEMDDTPPFVVNEEALEIAIEIALMLNCQIADEVHVSRKQYLDGSIPTGFQRTIAVGVNGWIPFGRKKINIVQVCLEEDACREISDRGHVIVFRTDRLSVPLVEVITAPDMKTPSEACGVDREIGRILRATGKVRRGIGTVRQDVNVSVRGGTRVEIKGVPKTGKITRLVHGEAIRQKSILSLREKANELADALETRTADCTDIFLSSRCVKLRDAAQGGMEVGAILLGGFADFLRWRLSPNRTFEDELAGRVRVIACIDEEPVIYSSAGRAGSGPSETEWTRVRERLGASEEDAVIIVRGNAADVGTALSEIRNRVEETKEGVPSETRQVLEEGETDFERILPGPDRMYPDTDSAPIPLCEEMVERIHAGLRPAPWEWRSRYGKVLKPGTIDQLIDMDAMDRFREVLEGTGCDPKLLAYTLTSTIPFLRRRGHDVSSISSEDLAGLFRLSAEGKIIRESIPEALVRMVRGRSVDNLIVDDPGMRSLKDELMKVGDTVAEEYSCRMENPEKTIRYLIGVIKNRMDRPVSGKMILKTLMR